jgi:hypothetical protein
MSPSTHRTAGGRADAGGLHASPPSRLRAGSYPMGGIAGSATNKQSVTPSTPGASPSRGHLCGQCVRPVHSATDHDWRSFLLFGPIATRPNAGGLGRSTARCNRLSSFSMPARTLRLCASRSGKRRRIPAYDRCSAPTVSEDAFRAPTVGRGLRSITWLPACRPR